MNPLEAALRAHDLGDINTCTQALEAARRTVGDSPELFAAWATTAAMCSRMNAEQLSTVIDIIEHPELVAATAQRWLQERNPDCVTVSRPLHQLESRFKVLHLRCAATFNQLDIDTLAATPPRVIERAIAMLDGKPAALLLGEAVTVVERLQHRQLEAVNNAGQHFGPCAALHLAERIAEHTPHTAPDIAEAAAAQAKRCGDRQAAHRWVELCPTEHSTRRAHATLTGDRDDWNAAVQATIAAHGNQNCTDTTVAATLVAAAATASVNDLRAWLRHVDVTEEQAVLDVAQLMTSSGMLHEARLLLERCGTPRCQLRRAELTHLSDTDSSVELLTSLSRDRNASPDVIVQACEKLVDLGHRPAGNLVAAINSDQSTFDTIRKAGQLLRQLVNDGSPAGPKVKAALTTAGRIMCEHADPDGVNMIAVAAEHGSGEAFDTLTTLRGDHRLGGWATFTLAGMAASSGFTTEAVHLAVGALRHADNIGDQHLAAHCKTFIDTHTTR